MSIRMIVKKLERQLMPKDPRSDINLELEQAAIDQLRAMVKHPNRERTPEDQEVINHAMERLRQKQC